MFLSNNLSHGARRLRFGTGAALAAVLGVTVYAAVAALIGPGQADEVQILGSDGVPAGRAGLIAAALTGLPLSIALWRLMRMLREIERGRIFTAATIRELRGFALFVMLSALASIVVLPAFNIAAALAAGADQTKITLTLDTADFFSVLISVLLFFVARLFGEAQRIADENEQIV